jgi:two-component system, chemotaxis family, CheB/CheR fusion protein
MKRKPPKRSGRAGSPAKPEGAATKGSTLGRQEGGGLASRSSTAAAERGGANKEKTLQETFAAPDSNDQVDATDDSDQESRDEDSPNSRQRDDSLFPIVGIGASAGGLEALERFLKNVPEQSGMAFVIIQHLDPAHKGSLAEILQRSSRMRVMEVKDRQKVERDCVYLIPPGKDMSILGGTLHLLPQALPRGLNLPIDFFFRALAADQQERSIAVVLSGMGSDGTLGIRAIKEKAGAAFVQSLDSAKFDGMPKSAIDAGLADVIAPVEELPRRILGYRRHAAHIARVDEPIDEKSKGSLEKVFILLRAQTGNDFSLYKKSTIYRRIERRMGLQQIDRVPDYIRFLRENPREIELLFRELLIGVTSFFRDPPAWEYLKNEALPARLSARSGGSIVRAWVPGCSTGEEAYSLAMVLKEALEAVKPARNITFQVFATDLDKEAIDKARQGIYPANIVADVSPARLRRFFIQDERGFRVGKEIREIVVFAPQNIVMDPPFTKLDVLSCRNLLIYLSPELQKKLIPLFHYSLNPGGLLFLGSAETIGSLTGLFVAADSKTRIYRRLESGIGMAHVNFPDAFIKKPPHAAGDAEEPDAHPTWPPPNLQVLADHVLVQRFSPAALLTSDKGDILYISGRTGKYLEPAVGKASMNVFAMAREGLRLQLSSAFSTAVRQNRTVTVQGVKVGTNGGTQTVDLTVQKLFEPKELRGTVMIVITDVESGKATKTTTDRAPSGRTLELQQELQRAHDEIQTTREEMQTSQEELKSTNEELQSTNEELQSTNEELTTSKEEMQSMNEELQTVNHELQCKVDELSRATNDMKNLLNSTDIATLFLDGNLLVRRFTTPTADLIKLIPADAGRAITDIARDIDYPELADDAREVLRTLVFKERRVAATQGRWFSVRIMPYRTLENVIDGVVITFTDASAVTRMEGMLRQQANELKQITESVPDLVWNCPPNGLCDYVSPQWVKYTGIPASELHGYSWLDAVHGDDREMVRQHWLAAVKSSKSLDLELRLRDQKGSFRWFRLLALPIRDAQGNVVKWYGTSSDIDDLKAAIEHRKKAADRLISVLENVNEPFFALTEGETISYANTAAQRLVGRLREAIVGQPVGQILPEAGTDAFRESFRRAAREGRESSLEAQFNEYPKGGRFQVRVFPGAEGVAMLLQRSSEALVATEPDGN